jgi:hypothetical protein
MAVEIDWLGPIGNAGGNWHGTIANNLDAPESGRLKKLVENSYESVAQDAAIRCIDGRIGDVHKEIGPQAAGGGPGFTLAYHIVEGGSDIVSDFMKFWQMHENSKDNFVIGGHIDDHSKPPMSGCGAIDRMPEILETANDAKNREGIQTYVQAIMADIYDENIFDEVMAMLATLEPMDYFRSHDNDYRQDLLKEITSRADRNVVEKLSGNHKEVFVIVNRAPMSSLDKEKFVHSADGNAQAFSYDFWYVQELAAKMFPNSKAAQVKFCTANIIFNIAAAMVLTDGSLDLGVRS